MKQTLIWFNFQRDGSGNGFLNVNHQSMRIFKAGLSSLYDVMARAGQNIKKKYT